MQKQLKLVSFRHFILSTALCLKQINCKENYTERKNKAVVKIFRAESVWNTVARQSNLDRQAMGFWKTISRLYDF